MQRSVEQHEQELAKCVPSYYQRVFEEVERVLREGRKGESMGKREDQADSRRGLMVEEWLQKAEAYGWQEKELLKRWHRFRTA